MFNCTKVKTYISKYLPLTYLCLYLEKDIFVIGLSCCCYKIIGWNSSFSATRYYWISLNRLLIPNIYMIRFTKLLSILRQFILSTQISKYIHFSSLKFLSNLICSYIKICWHMYWKKVLWLVSIFFRLHRRVKKRVSQKRSLLGRSPLPYTQYIQL